MVGPSRSPHKAMITIEFLCSGATHNMTTVSYSIVEKTENKRYSWFQASGTYVVTLEQVAW